MNFENSFDNIFECLVLQISDSKLKMKNRIKEVKDFAEKLKRKALLKANDFISKIILNLSNTLKKLNQFTDLCCEIIQTITKYPEFEKKPYRSPLENALFSAEITNFLRLIVPPLLNFNEMEKSMTYVPSILSHILQNYTNFTISFPEDNYFRIYPSIISEEFQLNASSRCLSVSPSKILFTGVSNTMKNCFVFDVLTQEFSNISDLISPRKYHSMCWINGRVAVIGGRNEKGTLKSVEVLENDAWVNFTGINEARSNHSSISNLKSTWVFGGYNKEKLDSIEVFKDLVWKVLKIKLESQINGVGTLCVDQSVLVFGGINSEGNVACESFEIDEKTKKKLKPLEKSAYFSYNLCYFNGNECSFMGKNFEKIPVCVNINLKSIYA